MTLRAHALAGKRCICRKWPTLSHTPSPIAWNTARRPRQRQRLYRCSWGPVTEQDLHADDRQRRRQKEHRGKHDEPHALRDRPEKLPHTSPLDGGTRERGRGRLQDQEPRALGRYSGPARQRVAALRRDVGLVVRCVNMVSYFDRSSRTSRNADVPVHNAFPVGPLDIARRTPRRQPCSRTDRSRTAARRSRGPLRGTRHDERHTSPIAHWT